MYCNELKFGRKKIFSIVVYQSPAFKHSSPEFDTFLSNFGDLYSKIKAENPYTTFFTGDFNAHSQFWCPDGDTNLEEREIENLFFSLNLSQIISESTNFEPGKKPSCIDLVVTDQHYLVLDSRFRASLDSNCHHQIIHCKVNFRIPPPPRFERKIWNYKKQIQLLSKGVCPNFPGSSILILPLILTGKLKHSLRSS